MPFNNVDNLIYTLDFETQHIYPDNLPLITIPSKNQTYAIDYKAITAFLCGKTLSSGGGRFQPKTRIPYIRYTLYIK